jgi:hypothetical protein
VPLVVLFDEQPEIVELPILKLKLPAVVDVPVRDTDSPYTTLFPPLGMESETTGFAFKTFIVTSRGVALAPFPSTTVTVS